MHRLSERRELTSVSIGFLIGLYLVTRHPFPGSDVILSLIHTTRPAVFFFLKVSYIVFLFTTPYFICSLFLSLIFIFLYDPGKRGNVPIHLPGFTPPEKRQSLYVTFGEIHHPRKPVPIANPKWLDIPERGLHTGTLILGAIGSAKTAGCMYPFADQILGFKPQSKEEKVGAIVLEVKGDFCYQIQKILKKHNRTADYFEVSLNTEHRYNPLNSKDDPYAMAYQVASLLNNLFGKGKEPFWQQAYTNLVKFIIHLHLIRDNYVTFFDIYQAAINSDRLKAMIDETEESFERKDYVLLDSKTYIESIPLLGPLGEQFQPFDAGDNEKRHRSIYSGELKATLDEKNIEHELYSESKLDPDDEDRKAKFEAVKRWFQYDWDQLDHRLKTSIVEGISVFLSLFDDNPKVKKVFCPDKRCFDPELNKSGQYGKPMPSFSELIEEGKVIALNFPVGMNPALARVIGTMLKMDFQRAMLHRIPEMAQHPENQYRSVLFLADEYQNFATTGEDNPNGDEKFFAMSRQAKLIPIVATQSMNSLRTVLPGETWRTLIQSFRNRVFLGTEDDLTAREAAGYCGKEDKKKINVNVSESSRDAKVSFFSGKAYSDKASVSVSKSFNVQRDFIFDTNIFTQLSIYQAVVVAFDGQRKLPPMYCYLKPYYLSPDKSYFHQLMDNEL